MVRQVTKTFRNIISIDWLEGHLDDPNLIILDATMKKKPNGETIPTPAKKIIKAQEFNFDTEICDKQSKLPHMMCSADAFESYAKNLGINHDSVVIIYDAMGIFSSPRAWWMFKLMGHKQVYILDGGLPAWLKANKETSSNYFKATSKGNFISTFLSELVVDSNQMMAILNNPYYQIIDARSYARFTAQEDEPRKELKRGHIPNSYCLPFAGLLENGFIRDTEQLDTLFKNIVYSEAKQLVFSCGSGVTACILALSADECGYDNYTIYDGSWSEWGAGEKFPISTKNSN